MDERRRERKKGGEKKRGGGDVLANFSALPGYGLLCQMGIFPVPLIHHHHHHLLPRYSDVDFYLLALFYLLPLGFVFGGFVLIYLFIWFVINFCVLAKN